MHPIVVLELALALAERVEQAALCLCSRFHSFAKLKHDLQYCSLSQEGGCPNHMCLASQLLGFGFSFVFTQHVSS